MNQLDWKDIFGSTPEGFRRRVEETLQKTAAEQAAQGPVKRSRPVRTALIAALIIALLSAAAYAAAVHWKLFDFFEQHYNFAIPKAAQDVLEQSEARTYTLGKATFTRQESIADGRLVYFSTVAKPVGDPAILYWTTGGELIAPVGEALAKYIGCEPTLSFQEAARKSGLPLYGVAVRPTLHGESAGDEMMDIQYQEDGSLVLINQVQCRADGPEVALDYEMDFGEIDPETGEFLEGTKLRHGEPLTVPVQATLGVRTFVVPDERIIGSGATRLKSVTLTQKATGIYVAMELAVVGEESLDELRWKVYGSYALLDDEGNYLPIGMSLSGDCDMSRYPEALVLEMMVSLDAMPERINVGLMEPDSGEKIAVYPLTTYTDEEAGGQDN